MKRTDEEYILRALSVFTILLVIAFLAVLGRVLYLEIGERQYWTQRAEDWTIRISPVDAKRGNIYAIDADTGEKLLLATNKKYWDVYIDLGRGKTQTKSGKDTIDWIVPEKEYKEGITKLCVKLAEMFPGGKTANERRAYFDAQRKKGNRYVLVQKMVFEEQLERFKELPIVGRQKVRKGRVRYSLSPAVAKE